MERVSVTLDSGSSRAKKEAQKLLDDKIENVLQKLTTTSALFHTVFFRVVGISSETDKTKHI